MFHVEHLAEPGPSRSTWNTTLFPLSEEDPGDAAAGDCDPDHFKAVGVGGPGGPCEYDHPVSAHIAVCDLRNEPYFSDRTGDYRIEGPGQLRVSRDEILGSPLKDPDIREAQLTASCEEKGDSLALGLHERERDSIVREPQREARDAAARTDVEQAHRPDREHSEEQ